MPVHVGHWGLSTHKVSCLKAEWLMRKKARSKFLWGATADPRVNFGPLSSRIPQVLVEPLGRCRYQARIPNSSPAIPGQTFEILTLAARSPKYVGQSSRARSRGRTGATSVQSFKCNSQAVDEKNGPECFHLGGSGDPGGELWSSF